jgi:hypothetical protein
MPDGLARLLSGINSQLEIIMTYSIKRIKLKLSRREAIEAKDKYYFTGKPCKHGHWSKRHTADGSCLQCRLDNQREVRKLVSGFGG